MSRAESPLRPPVAEPVGNEPVAPLPLRLDCLAPRLVRLNRAFGNRAFGNRAFGFSRFQPRVWKSRVSTAHLESVQVRAPRHLLSRQWGWKTSATLPYLVFSMPGDQLTRSTAFRVSKRAFRLRLGTARFNRDGFAFHAFECDPSAAESAFGSCVWSCVWQPRVWALRFGGF